MKKKTDESLQDQVEKMVEDNLSILKDILSNKTSDQDVIAQQKLQLSAYQTLLTLRRQTKPEENTGVIDAAVAARILTGGTFKGAE